MKYEVTGKNGFVPTPAIKDYAEKRLQKVVDFFGNDVITVARVTCKVYKDHHKIEVTIPAPNIILRAEVSDKDMYTAIDRSVDALLAQIRKHKTKLQNHFEKEGIKQAFNQELDVESLEKEILATQLVKNKQVELVPMTSEEAILAMEVSGHSFYVYQDKDTHKVNVVYAREDGDYAVIETK
ncbi:Ribosome-associated factor Y [Alteracholeplasma palmae J233]|uniref:Ribosome hibernation promoting factor n=1 Tax=Alteracholeplasma palmae (strain ATCC 49389 / J233) TaxID=1318466 RepID=U4KKE2_ALTPJ|nr:ribosome-associated translation inhibitor RaiA [Alteracholeplasma palmae]CCV64018.1 Ribosome-associated factor Y [Alteracholeplasma palmae J233]